MQGDRLEGVALGGLALASGQITQLTLVGVQVPLEAEGQRLVTGAQLLLTPAPLGGTLDVPPEKGVVVVVEDDVTFVRFEVTVAAVVFVAAPVCGISGLALATKSAVAAVGRIEEDGGLPRHLFDHLVQVQHVALSWSHTSKDQQHAEQGEAHDPSTEQ